MESSHGVCGPASYITHPRAGPARVICSAVPRSNIAKSTMRIGIVSDTHNHIIKLRDQTLVVNPGESAGHVKGRNAVGILNLMSLRTEILNF